MNSLLQMLLILLFLFILFVLSRLSLQKLFELCHRYIGNNHAVYIAISLFLLPGTIVHELSHAFMAMALHLKIRDIHIFPEWQHNHIKLGSVVYEKKDVFRSILVGVAPFFVGLCSLWWFYQLGVYQISSIPQFLVVTYIVFVISTTMFSSKQDLVDILYLIPVIVFVTGAVYIFQLNLGFVWKLIEVEAVKQFMYAIGTYLMIAIGIHSIIIIFATIMLVLHKKT